MLASSHSSRLISSSIDYSAIDNVTFDTSLGKILAFLSNTNRFFPSGETSPESILPSRV
jgi:hypothetical protein